MQNQSVLSTPEDDVNMLVQQVGGLGSWAVYPSCLHTRLLNRWGTSKQLRHADVHACTGLAWEGRPLACFCRRARPATSHSRVDHRADATSLALLPRRWQTSTAWRRGCRCRRPLAPRCPHKRCGRGWAGGMGLAAGKAPSQHWGVIGERRLCRQLVGRGAAVGRGAPGLCVPMPLHPAAPGCPWSAGGGAGTGPGAAAGRAEEQQIVASLHSLRSCSGFPALFPLHIVCPSALVPLPAAASPRLCNLAAASPPCGSVCLTLHPRTV